MQAGMQRTVNRISCIKDGTLWLFLRGNVLVRLKEECSYHRELLNTTCVRPADWAQADRKWLRIAQFPLSFRLRCAHNCRALTWSCMRHIMYVRMYVCARSHLYASVCKLCRYVLTARHLRVRISCEHSSCSNNSILVMSFVCLSTSWKREH